MPIFQLFSNFVLHLDKQLPALINSIGSWTYLVIFLVIFIETGLVILPFLPGDSLIFTTGAVAALPATRINLWLALGIIIVAAVLGDTNNYWIGHRLGRSAFSGRYRWIKKDYLARAEAFYQRHGRKTIFLARFIPIIRSFAPFVAGLGRMAYQRFITYNITGGAAWTVLFLGAGYFFGSTPLVKTHFSLLIVMVIVISTIPAAYEVIKARQEKSPSG